jgi:apolipoprotein N-acyltransferase
MDAPVGDFRAPAQSSPYRWWHLTIGPLICYEDIFPQISWRLAREGAELFVNQTNDAWYDSSSAAYQHLAASVFRAVENRRTLVRAANTGVSAVVDPLGRIVIETALLQPGVVTATVRIAI